MERICDRLSNGIRVAVTQSDGNVTYAGVLTNAGSRDDFPGCDGLAHFVEHTIFKGTTSRKGFQVANRMENVGGYLNAYTSKDQIMVYTGSPTGYERRAIELLADLVGNASFPAEEVNREKGVVLEEIHSYRDNAADAVFDEFDELFYKGSPLAHNILGYDNTVERLTSNDTRNFLTTNFTADDMVLYCMSPLPPQKVVAIMEQYFGRLERRMTQFRNRGDVPPLAQPFSETRSRGNEQANTLLGVRLFGACDERRFPLFLLSNLLGGPSMNSRLNRELRERRGLVYSVESSVSLYEDTGSFQIYFATEPAQVKRCTELATRELECLASRPLSDNAFAKATRQICGQLLVNGDNRESTAMAMAKSLMRHGEILDSANTARMIQNLTPGDLQQMARFIIERPLNRLTLI